MRLKLLDIILVVVVVVLGVLLYNRFRNQNNVTPISDNEVAQASVEKDLEDVLGIQIPDDGEKLELSDGDSRAVVTKTEEGLSIIADLPEGNYQVTGLGRMIEAKGGYILNSTNKEINNIEIKKGNEVILQGSFNE